MSRDACLIEFGALSEVFALSLMLGFDKWDAEKASR